MIGNAKPKVKTASTPAFISARAIPGTVALTKACVVKPQPKPKPEIWPNESRGSTLRLRFNPLFLLIISAIALESIVEKALTIFTESFKGPPTWTFNPGNKECTLLFPNAAGFAYIP